MSDRDDKTKRETPLEKSIKEQNKSHELNRIEHVREDRQIVRDELPPLYPVDPDE